MRAFVCAAFSVLTVHPTKLQPLIGEGKFTGILDPGLQSMQFEEAGCQQELGE